MFDNAINDPSVMADGAKRKPISARLWLTIVALCQVFLTPLAAFALTYLVKFDVFGENITISFQKEMIPWIITASLIYGMMALFLALLLGGYMPIKVVDSGGWRRFFRLSRSHRDATERRISRRKFANSPHGKISVLVHQRWENGHSIISTHGGLILLAVPFQVMLATLPLATVLIIPDSIMRENRRLEFALLLYIFILAAVMKYYPILAKKYIGVASFTRKWLISMTRISLLAPVLILWLMGRMASVVVLGWIGSDIDLNIEIEKSFFETTLNIGSIPETSFLDLIAALAVIPLATFITLSVLGAGAGEPPEWMTETLQMTQKNEPIAQGIGIISAASAISTDAIAELGSQINPIENTSPTEEEIISSEDIVDEPRPLNLPSENLDIDFDSFFGDGFGEANKRPSHDEPSISGLGFGESND